MKPAAPVRRCRTGEGLTDNFIPTPTAQHHDWEWRGRLLAVSCWGGIRVELPIPGNRPVSQGIRQPRQPVYGDRSRKEEPKLLYGGMPLVRSLTCLLRPHLGWELLIFPHTLMPVVCSFKDRISLTEIDTK